MKLDPEMARIIALAITQRSLATEMINTTLHRKEYSHVDFMFWRDEHILATQKLAAFGIEVPTYTIDEPVAVLQ